MADPKPRVPEGKVAEARALWEIAILYIALGAAARTIKGGTAASGAAASGGFRASQLLARAYYRLMRAIWTGYTLSDRGVDPGDRTSLRELYSDFETLAYRAIPSSKHSDVRRRVRVAGSNYEDAMRDLYEHEADLSTDDERYSDDPDLVEAGEEFTSADGEDYASDLTGDRDWSDELDIIAEALEDAERHLADVEKAEAEELKRLEEEVAKIDRDQKRLAAKTKQAARLRAAKDRGKRAGAAMKAAQQGARSEVVYLTQADDRSKGFVSVPKGPNPCYWCMMLASRGAMSYKTRPAPASVSGQWHDNCNCGIEPIFDLDHYYNSPTFALNRNAYKLWQEFKRKGGDWTDPKKWREHFDQGYRGGKSLSDLMSKGAIK